MSLLPCFLILAMASCRGVAVRVTVEQGVLEGEQLELVTGDGQYYSFKGIPYAAPPVGNLRFMAPKSPAPWTGVRNATQHGSECTQYNMFIDKFSGSEDCLFLNVYSLDLKPKKLLPVMVFIHGGLYEFGSGNDDFYGPDFLVQTGVVLITINYRLGPLGFLSLETAEVPGNAGMKDQVAALKWVKRNIRAFGGDPDNVTIFGQSAGGASVILHMISPMSKGLFKRVISMSGVPSCDWSIPYQPRRRAFVLGKQLGVDTEDPNRLLDFLRSVPGEKLVGTRPNVLIFENVTEHGIKMIYNTPVVEKDIGKDHFLTEEPEVTLENKHLNYADLMIGHTNEESIDVLVDYKESIITTYSQLAEMVVPRKVLYKRSPDKILEIADLILDHYFGAKPIGNNTLRELQTYLNDSTYFYDIYRYIRLIANIFSPNDVYVYRFSCISSRNIYGKKGAKYGLFGASHIDDTVYLFDPKSANLKIDKSDKAYKMIQQLCALFTNFAKYGNPTPDCSLGAVWTKYNNVTEHFLEIAETLTPGQALDADVAKFWKNIYQKLDIDFYW